MLKDEHPWHLGPGSFLQLTAYASVAELIADIIPTVPNAAIMAIIIIDVFICPLCDEPTILYYTKLFLFKHIAKLFRKTT